MEKTDLSELKANLTSALDHYELMSQRLFRIKERYDENLRKIKLAPDEYKEMYRKVGDIIVFTAKSVYESLKKAEAVVLDSFQKYQDEIKQTIIYLKANNGYKDDINAFEEKFESVKVVKSLFYDRIGEICLKDFGVEEPEDLEK